MATDEDNHVGVAVILLSAVFFAACYGIWEGVNRPVGPKPPEPPKETSTYDPDAVCFGGPWAIETRTRRDDRPHRQGGRGGSITYYHVVCLLRN